ncbi:MAG: hypothetical protein AB7P03_14520 [Kofleriaceae bacterium]
MPAANLPHIEFSAYPRIPYWTHVRTPVFEIITTITNRVDRDMRREIEARAPGLRMYVRTHAQMARRTWEVIEALNDRKTNPLDPAIAVVFPPLARVIAESLISTAFVFEDPSTRLTWFFKAAWRAVVDHHAERDAEYGQDPAWQPYLAALANERDEWVRQLADQGTPLTPEELADPEEVPYWPNPGSMKRQTTDRDRKAVIAYVQAKFYGFLSAASHLSGIGWLAQGGALLPEPTSDFANKYFSDRVMEALTLLLGLLSQLTLDVLPEPALARRVVGLWGAPNMPGNTLEAYTRCFKAPLEALAAR